MFNILIGRVPLLSLGSDWGAIEDGENLSLPVIQEIKVHIGLEQLDPGSCLGSSDEDHVALFQVVWPHIARIAKFCFAVLRLRDLKEGLNHLQIDHGSVSTDPKVGSHFLIG